MIKLTQLCSFMTKPSFQIWAKFNFLLWQISLGVWVGMVKLRLIGLLDLQLNLLFLLICETCLILHYNKITCSHFMSILALISFVTMSFIFQIFADWQFFFIVNMQKLTEIALFTLTFDPMHTNNLFFFCLFGGR